MFDTIRGYASVLAGLAEAGARAAWTSVEDLIGEDLEERAMPVTTLPHRVQDMADGMVSGSRQSSELLVGLVRTEVDRAVGRLGFVREEELAAVRRHVQRLESQLGRATGMVMSMSRSGAGAAPDETGDETAAPETADEAAPATAPATAPAKKPAAKKSAVKKSAAKKAAVKKPAAKKAPATPSPGAGNDA